MDVLIASEDLEGTVRRYMPSNADLSNMCSFFAVFTDVTRVRMLSALCIGELCVNDLAAILDLNQTTVSHQLRILKDAGMVVSRREGKIIFYRAESRFINAVMLTGADYLEHIS